MIPRRRGGFQPPSRSGKTPTREQANAFASEGRRKLNDPFVAAGSRRDVTASGIQPET